ncbi:MAG: phosphoribosylglycinamide formyltransferase [Candidatus Sericytochromatia bacterium]|nr:phosphoribosylglycinamide formyltransferase [Candidatus Tanganyikabacteria bacterium]
MRLAVFASGSGSNLAALLTACEEGRLPARAVGAVCNNPGAGAISRAERFGLPVFVCDHRAFSSREAHEEAILAWLRPLRPDWIALAGYMRLLTPHFLRAYPGRVVNIHPADTRRHKGGGGYEWALREGLTETCVTVHYVDEGMDTGDIIAQAPVAILPGDTLESLEARGLAVEHELYVRALAGVIGPGAAAGLPGSAGVAT